MQSKLVLALDNSLDFLNIALAHEEILLEERHIKPQKPASQSIPEQVLQILADHCFDVDDISLIVATVGPGSFTGIRVGLAFCKGLASGRKIPLIGVPTQMCSFLHSHSFKVTSSVLFSTLKREVFASLYLVSHGNIERHSDYHALKPAEVAHTLKTPCLCFGTGVRYVRIFSHLLMVSSL